MITKPLLLFISTSVRSPFRSVIADLHTMSLQRRALCRLSTDCSRIQQQCKPELTTSAVPRRVYYSSTALCDAQPKLGLCIAALSSSLFFYDFCLPDYLYVQWTDLHQMRTVGRTVAVNERSGVSFSICRETLTWQPILLDKSRPNPHTVVRVTFARAAYDKKCNCRAGKQII